MSITNASDSRPRRSLTAHEIEEQQAKLPPELEPAARKLIKLVQGHRRGFFQGYYDIGELVRDEFDRQQQRNETTYGQRVVEQLAEKAQIGPRTLRQCLTLARFYSRDEFLELTSIPGITWSHIVHLLTFSEKSKREGLTAQIKSSKWTADELAAEIRKSLPVRSKAGRPLATPRSVKHGIIKLLSASNRFSNSMDQVWFGPAFDIPSQIANLPPDEVSQELREFASQAIEQFHAIEAQVAASAERMQGSLSHIDQVLAHRIDNAEQ